MSTATKKYPNPVYAAAAAGDLAYRQLRRLPGKLTELRDRMAVADVDIKADLVRLRTAAQRGAAAVLDEAKNVYADLVVRGQQVVAGTERAASDRQPAPTAELATEPAAAASKPATAASKPAKRTAHRGE